MVDDSNNGEHGDMPRELCSQCGEMLAALVDGTLSKLDVQDTTAHIAVCDRCRWVVARTTERVTRQSDDGT